MMKKKNKHDSAIKVYKSSPVFSSIVNIRVANGHMTPAVYDTSQLVRTTGIQALYMFLYPQLYQVKTNDSAYASIGEQGIALIAW